MGYITTIQFSNDAASNFKKYPEQTVDNIIAAMDGMKNHVSVGDHCNPMKPMPTIHASDFALYCSSGNTLVDMNPFSDETLSKMEQFPDFYDDLIDNITYRLKELKNARTEIRNKK